MLLSLSLLSILTYATYVKPSRQLFSTVSIVIHFLGLASAWWGFVIVAVGGMKGIGNMGKGGIPKGNGTGGTGVPPLFTEVGRLVLLFKPAVPVGSINFIFLVSGWLPSLELPCSSSCFFKNVSTSFSLSWSGTKESRRISRVSQLGHTKSLSTSAFSSASFEKSMLQHLLVFTGCLKRPPVKGHFKSSGRSLKWPFLHMVSSPSIWRFSLFLW